MAGVYYNENDPYAADWLENLIADGLIAGGVVDRRSIADVPHEHKLRDMLAGKSVGTISFPAEETF